MYSVTWHFQGLTEFSVKGDYDSCVDVYFSLIKEPPPSLLFVRMNKKGREDSVREWKKEPTDLSERILEVHNKLKKKVRHPLSINNKPHLLIKSEEGLPDWLDLHLFESVTVLTSESPYPPHCLSEPVGDVEVIYVPSGLHDPGEITWKLVEQSRKLRIDVEKPIPSQAPRDIQIDLLETKLEKTKRLAAIEPYLEWIVGQAPEKVWDL